MANQTDYQIVEEGPRNAVIKLTGALDTANVNLVSVVAPSLFKNNDVNLTALVGFRVDHINYSIGNGLEVLLAWNGNSPQQITPLAGRGKIDASDDGGFVPDQTRGGYDGSINLTTSGFSAGTIQYYTIFLRLIKLYKV